MSQSAPLNTRYTLHLLSTKTSDSSPSLLVTFDDARYLFNAPESISRICVQNKVSMKKIGKVFLGELQESGGLPGVIFTTVEAGNHKLEVIGPQGLDHFVSSFRYYVKRELLSLKLTNTPVPDSPLLTLPPPIHSDSNLIVYAFPITSTSPPESVTTPTLKRKRSSTSPSPPRPSLSPPVPRATSPPPSSAAIHMETSSISSTTTISSEVIPATIIDPPMEIVDTIIHTFDTSEPDFNPTSFRGEKANAWRTAVLADMFRGKAFIATPLSPLLPTLPSLPPVESITSPDTLVDSSISILTTSEATVPTILREPQKDTLALYRESRSAPTPSYFTSSLPPPTDNPYVRKPKIANSYLVQGPALRGKFLPAEALKRGVRPGPDFSKLANGEKVWIAREIGVVKKVDEKIGETIKLTKRDAAKARAEEEKARRENRLPEGEGDGVWVLPEECLGEGSEANAFLIINIPSIDFIPSLTSIPTSLFTNLEGANLHTVLHFLGPSVMTSPDYSTFLNSFPENVVHRITSPDLPNSDPVTFAPAALLSLRLSKLDSEIFSLPHYSFDESSKPSRRKGIPSSFPESTIRLNSNDILSKATELVDYPHDIRTFNFGVPSTEADLEAARLKSSNSTEKAQALEVETYARYLEKAKEAREIVQIEMLAKKEVRKSWTAEMYTVGGSLKVTPLGTGSATPSKYRNVSGTLLHLPDGGYILLDAGEGTWGQIARRFGEEGAAKVLSKIKLIFVSHMHADHHAGLVKILKMRKSLSEAPQDILYFIAPAGIRTYLYEQQQLFDIGIGNRAEIQFIDSWAIESHKINRDNFENWTTLKTSLGLKDLTPVPVLHRCRCWGLVIGHTSGWKVVFSGDTMPSDQLVVAGQGATLLIHEATMEDELEDMARAKGHSTYGQAVDIARRMGATYCLLTHFSARYPKLPSRSRPILTAPSLPITSTSTSISEQVVAVAKPKEPLVAVAFDLMTIQLSDFWKIEKYRDAMDVLFEDADNEGDNESVAEVSIVQAKKVDKSGNGKGKEKGKGKGTKKEKAKQSGELLRNLKELIAEN